jgi:hypothetical protein
MGIFTDADCHPFDESERQPTVEDARGRYTSEQWPDERSLREYVRTIERPRRGLYIRDEARF